MLTSFVMSPAAFQIVLSCNSKTDRGRPSGERLWVHISFISVSFFAEPFNNNLFDYEEFFRGKIDAKKKDHSYRVFKKVRKRLLA